MTTLSPQTKTHQTDRSDQEWIAALRGSLGLEAQHDALEELATYQQVVAYNYLKKCETLSATLTALRHDEIAALAEDHAYNFIERLVTNNFELLDKYSGTGRFTAWSARVLVNAMISEMRRASWRRQVPLTDAVSATHVDRKNRQPEEWAVQESIMAIVQGGLDSLPERYQVVITRCLIEGDSAQSVADDLETTQNAVNVLVYRAKNKLRNYLLDQGLDQSVVGHFA